MFDVKGRNTDVSRMTRITRRDFAEGERNADGADGRDLRGGGLKFKVQGLKLI
jgi:hypothetical protein